jgi:hypothetical protein
MAEVLGEVAPLSPFIPGTQIQWAWDSTSLGLLKECPEKYFQTLIRGLRRKGNSPHLDFGSAFHAALEYFDYLLFEGKSREDCIRETLRFTLVITYQDYKLEEVPKKWYPLPNASDPLAHPKKNRDTLVRSVLWYLFHYENDSVKTIKLPNGLPAVELQFQMDAGFEHNGVPFVLVGRLDRLVDFNGDMYVLDRKTSSGAISSHYLRSFNPDNQMSTYTLASKVVFKTPVKGVIIDGAQILVGSTAFGRGITTRSDAQLEEWLEDTHEWFARAVDYATRNKWPKNDKSCHKYDGCPYRDMCSSDPMIRKNIYETECEHRPWNPLARDK